MSGVTAVIPSIPPRAAMLKRAVGSVLGQTLPAAALAVAVDVRREGAAKTRDRALRSARTTWVAFLDDDDEMLSEHLAILLATARETEADYVFSYYTVVDADGRELAGVDPLGKFGQPFDPEHPHQTTITTLVRTELAQPVGFTDPPEGLTIDGQRHGEDFEFTLGCVRAGARIVHVPRRTWLWRHHGTNTSGRSDRW